MNTVVRGIVSGLRDRPKTFVAVALGVLVLDVFLPPLVLSLARKPCDYATFNPWLGRLPEYLASSTVPLAKKLEFLPNLALFWFSADNAYGGGVEWGFAVTVEDLARFCVVALLLGLYATLLLSWRQRSAITVSTPRLGTAGGVFGAVTSVLGFSTGGCTVMGCGAPVLPVVGLAFVGLSSGTLTLLAVVSRVATGVVIGVLMAAVTYLGWRLGRASREATVPTERGA